MTEYELFMSIGEPYAAGLFADKEREYIYRYSKAYKMYWEHAVPTPYDGGLLYPCGINIRFNEQNRNIAVMPCHSYTMYINVPVLREKSEEAYQIIFDENDKLHFDWTPHTVGGMGFTHSFVNYQRILKEGLISYRKRVEALNEGDFKDGMRLVLEGIEIYKQHCIEMLKSSNAPQKLIDALSYVPEHTPRNIYEALVAWNFMFYIDGCDNIGGLDRGLEPYYNGEDILDLLKELFNHVNDNSGWSGALGPKYNKITLQCIQAVKGLRRPQLQLLVTPEMPEEIWQAVYESLATSCGQPALYNYAEYKNAFVRELPEVTEEEFSHLAFAGCTETELEGMCNVGSDDFGMNSALVFEKYMCEKLGVCKTFEEFFKGYCDQMYIEVGIVEDIVNKYRKDRARLRPHPERTLFTDDCLDTETDFTAGGARYYWSVGNVAGIINVIDSMLVIKELVYDKKKYNAEDFLNKLHARDGEFLADCKNCPSYGNDSPDADKIAHDLAESIYTAYDQKELYPRGRFFVVENQFVTFADSGKPVGATPDGRDAGDPLCDSLAPIHGNDDKGPTAMLNSVASLPLGKVFGTPVVNFRIRKEHLNKYLKPLVLAYFERGGMQLQVSCVSKEEMLDAQIHPENHRNLVVRIGGYSEYFNWLSKDLQDTVINRTEY